MPDEDSKIHREKSLKVPFIIFFDLECLLEKINRLFKDYYKPIKTNSAFNGNYIAKRFHTNNQECIDCLRPRPNKNECECEKCGCGYFYASNY